MGPRTTHVQQRTSCTCHTHHRLAVTVELVGKKAHSKLKDPNFVVFENTKRAMGLSYQEVVSDLPRSADGVPLLTPFVEVVQHPEFPQKPMLKGKPVIHRSCMCGRRHRMVCSVRPMQVLQAVCS